MSKTVKFGVVGTNFISDRFSDAVGKSHSAEVVAVLSRTIEGAKAFAERHNIPNVYDDEKAFLADSKIDAVYVAVPNSLHYAYTERALSAGKHVLCEKPMALCRAEFDRLCEKARSCGKLLIEAMRPAFDPAYRTLIEALPEIGKIRYGYLDFSQYSSRYDAFQRGEMPRAFDSSYGNAAVMDIGIYPLYVAAMLFGKPNSLSAHSVFLENGFEGMGQVTLTYTDMLLNVAYSKITQSALPSVITGEKGSIIINKLSEPQQLILRSKEGKEEKMPLTPLPNNMVYEVETFSEYVLSGKTTHTAMRASRIAIQMADEIRRQCSIRFSPNDELFKC